MGGWSRITYFRPFFPPSPSPIFLPFLGLRRALLLARDKEREKLGWAEMSGFRLWCFLRSKKRNFGRKKKRAAVTRMKRENEPHHGFTFFSLYAGTECAQVARTLLIFCLLLSCSYVYSIMTLRGQFNSPSCYTAGGCFHFLFSHFPFFHFPTLTFIGH